jgi:hypothetical protein
LEGNSSSMFAKLKLLGKNEALSCTALMHIGADL